MKKTLSAFMYSSIMHLVSAPLVIYGLSTSNTDITVLGCSFWLVGLTVSVLIHRAKTKREQERLANR